MNTLTGLAVNLIAGLITLSPFIALGWLHVLMRLPR